MKLQIEYLKKEELKPYANNAKIHTDDQIEQIKRSIEEFGFNDPIAIWGDNEIIEGHGRLLAVMKMPEITEVPVIRLDDLSDEQRRAYMLVHNKLTMNTDFDVDSGATNRKLGSDMGDAVTGGGLHGKDLSKADVSVNIYAHLKAQEFGKPVELYCAIGDNMIDGRPYSEIVDIARRYIKEIGGFEKFAEWGLI